MKPAVIPLMSLRSLVLHWLPCALSRIFVCIVVILPLSKNQAETLATERLAERLQLEKLQKQGDGWLLASQEDLGQKAARQHCKTNDSLASARMVEWFNQSMASMVVYAVCAQAPAGRAAICHLRPEGPRAVWNEQSKGMGGGLLHSASHSPRTKAIRLGAAQAAGPRGPHQAVSPGEVKSGTV